MDPVVEISFDCLPLRQVSRVDVPLDASPGYRARLERLKQAIDRHAAGNAYFLYNTCCVYRLANSEVDGMLRFSFEGTVLTGPGDRKAQAADLEVELVAQTCGELPPAVLPWFRTIVERAVLIEFDRFIQAGNLERALAAGPLESIDDLEGFAGMNV